ncbi:hypothetical protein D9758_017860 [Tetrapyrgos nigripes]|uniref:VWFA domain-containing protein n=1 Tax=Tetrapyrgos nigripes TaxID=182062 RepID=A0A8H5FDF5_9AGAR|nr:hypothetical protein D9758_017860 [Tetrapyrgos nigripes]
MSHVNIPKTFGALLVGGLWASCLSGGVSVQSLLYQKLYNSDPVSVRLLVFFVWFLDTFHTGLIWGSLWEYLIDDYGRPDRIDHVPWYELLDSRLKHPSDGNFGCLLPNCRSGIDVSKRPYLLSVYIDVRSLKLPTISRLNRSIMTVSKMNRYFAAPLYLFAFLRLVSATATTVEMLRLESFSEFRNQVRWLFTTGLALSSSVDIMITGSLFYLLHSSRQKGGHLDMVIDSLIIYTFETGSFTCAATIVSMICWIVKPTYLVFMGLHFVIGKLYANSLLVSLNMRKDLRSRQNTGTSITFPSIPLPEYAHSLEVPGLVLDTRRHRNHPYHCREHVTQSKTAPREVSLQIPISTLSTICLRPRRCFHIIRRRGSGWSQEKEKGTKRAPQTEATPSRSSSESDYAYTLLWDSALSGIFQRSSELVFVRSADRFDAVSARVILTQTYYNPTDVATSRAKYVFPVPASAAIAAFEFHTSDGRSVTAVSKEKGIAGDEYEQAVNENKPTVLLEMISDDLFTISVGSIPAKQTIKTKLVYAMTLMNNDLADEIRFFLPMYVAERYGPPQAGLQGADTSSSSSRTRLRIQVDIQTSGQIQNISSPSHSSSDDDLSIERYPTHLNRPSKRRMKVKFRSSTFLDRDFILLIRAKGLDAPRCFAEIRNDSDSLDKSRDRSRTRTRNGSQISSYTLAVQLTIVPKAVLPSIPSQEYIFLLDRSGSMDGIAIETAKRTLILLLRQLPSQGSFFNVFGFGSTVESYWSRSCSYVQGALEDITSSIRKIQADLGGTELFQALDAVFLSRHTNVPTAVFVLTDGQVTDISSITSLVHSKVSKSPLSSPLRVFTLGIGDGVSTDLCESVARAGNGVYIYAREPESILWKCARLFRAGRTPMVQNVTVDWGFPDTLLSNASRSPSVDFSDRYDQLRPDSIRLKPPPIQQAPPTVTTIHSGMRTDVYAILSLKTPHAPDYVVLRGQLDNDGSAFEHKVKIRGVELADSEHGAPLIHTLAAWKIIQSHQEGVAPLPQASGVGQGDPAAEGALRKAAIVKLGTTYQLASRFTSFVAVDDSLSPTSKRNNMFSARPQVGLYGAGDIDMDQEERRTKGDRTSRSSAAAQRPVDPTQDVHIPGSWPTVSEEDHINTRSDDDEAGTDYSIQSFTTLSSLVSRSDMSSDWESSESEPDLLGPTNEQARSPSPNFGISSTGSTTPGHTGKTRHDQAAASTPTLITDLISLQTWDGSFRLDSSFTSLAPSAAGVGFRDLGVTDDVWATAVAVALMEKTLADSNPELLDDLLVKAMDFLSNVSNLEEVLKRAKEVLAQ